MMEKLTESEMRRIMYAYENSYLFLDDVPDFRERKRMFMDRRDRRVDAVNSWFRGNVPYDIMTRIHVRVQTNSKVSFEYPAESMVIVRPYRIDAEAADWILINLKEMQPDILVLDLSGASGEDPEAALEIVGALAEGEICTLRYRSFDRYTVSRRVSLRPYRIFVLTDGCTEGCAAMMAVSLYLNSGKVIVIGTELHGGTVGKVCMEGLGSSRRLTFSMASYRWSVLGRGPEVFSENGADRFIPCASDDIRERMSVVYGELRAGGWNI